MRRALAGRFSFISGSVCNTTCEYMYNKTKAENANLNAGKIYVQIHNENWNQHTIIHFDENGLENLVLTNSIWRE